MTKVSANTAKEHRYSNNTMQLTTQLHRYFSQVQSVGEFRFACLYFIDLQHSDCFYADQVLAGGVLPLLL